MPSKTLTCTVITPEKTEHYERLRSVSFTTVSGAVEILPSHAEGMFALREGDTVCTPVSGEPQRLSLSEAECHVRENIVTIIA